MTNKKEIERFHLNRFVSNKNLKLWVYDIEESETPDFVVTLDNKVVSIEHTRLINPDLKKVEQYKDKIIKNAQKRFEEKYAEKLYVLITFNNISLKSGKIAENEYTNEIFSLIEKIYLSNQGYEFKIDSKRNNHRVSKLISYLSVDNTWNFANWQHFGAYVVERMDLKWFQKVIDNKERNIKRYEKEFDENWLLLVSDFGTQASTHCFSCIDFNTIKTKFDKIYLYNFMPDEIEIVK